MDQIIKFENIKKSYNQKNIFKNFDLTINKGEFLTIIGSSGCGKTTLLKMINGLIRPDEGKIFVQGRDISQVNLIKLRRSIGYCIQGNVLFPHMTVEDNIGYVPNLLNKKDIKKTKNAVIKWLDLVGLDRDLLSRYPNELSGGQQQRVGIARSLAFSPEILLMDEPFSAVDSITRNQLQTLIKNIHDKTGITIIFITHDIFEALYLGTKVLVLNHGEVQQYSDSQTILEHPKNDFVKQLLNNAFHKGDDINEYSKS